MAKKKKPQQHQRPQIERRTRTLPRQAPTWRGLHPQHAGSPADRAITSTVTYPDSAAEAAWRRREPPTYTIHIPQNLIGSGDQQEYQEIARHNDAFVAPLQTGGFGVWVNSAEEALQAKNALDTWTNEHSEVGKKSRSNNPERLRSFTPAAKEKMERRWQKEVRRHLFRQCPPSGSTFQAIGTFLWPAQELNMKQVLGKSLEALDPVRVSSACYIIEGESDSLIRVLGDIKDVQAALVKIRKAFFQVVAQQQKATTTYLVHWDVSEGTPARIRAVETSCLDRTTPDNSLSFGVEQWDTASDASMLLGTATSILKSTILKSIQDLLFYNARMSFKITLGTFQADTYLPADSDGGYDFDEFHSMLLQTQFAATISPGCPWMHEQVLSEQIQRAVKVMPRDSTLVDHWNMRPVHEATFVFGSHIDGVHELVVSWQEAAVNGDHIKLERLPDTWSRLDASTRSRTPLLDVRMLRLNHGSTSGWHFDVAAAKCVPRGRIPPNLNRFAAEVKLMRQPRQQAQHFRPTFSLIAGCGLTSMAYATVKQFQFRDSGYIFDVSSSVVYSYSSTRSSLEPTQARDVHNTISIRHTAWDTMLSENAVLDAGQGARWKTDAATWFPIEEEEGKDGFDTLIEKLKYIEKHIGTKVDTEEYMGMDVA